MLEQIKNSLRNAIKTLMQRFSVTNAYPVKPGEYPRVGASFLGVSSSEAGPDGNIVITVSGEVAGIKFNVTGDSENRMGIAYDPNTLPPLNVNEVAVGAFSATIPSYLKFTNQGTIEVWKGGVLVIADLITHIHTGVTTGGGVSGPPAP